MMLKKHDALSLSNLQREDYLKYPYSFYEQLRDHDPVHWDEEMGYWVLSKYSDIEALYTDVRFSRAQGLLRGFERLSPGDRTVAEPVYRSFSKTMFYADPPYHTHLRGLMNHAFTPRRVEKLRPVIQQIVDDLLDAAEINHQMDVIPDLAYPLPVMVIAELLGLPVSDRARFKSWSDDLFAILGTVQEKSGNVLRRAAISLDEMTEYVRSLSRSRGESPRGDLLSVLLRAVEDDSANCPYPHGTSTHPSTKQMVHGKDSSSTLTEEELVANINILLSTGHETTTNLIGNGILALLQNPDQLRKLNSNPGLLTSALEEILRYDNPVQITYRSALEDAEIGGKVIRKGDLVNTIIGSANRDPQQFDDPDTFDMTRAEKRHLSFGLGIHFCIGASLVRLEAGIAFETLLRRFPGLHLTTDELQWQKNPIFRGLLSLPVGF